MDLQTVITEKQDQNVLRNYAPIGVRGVSIDIKNNTSVFDADYGLKICRLLLGQPVYI